MQQRRRLLPVLLSGPALLSAPSLGLCAALLLAAPARAQFVWDGSCLADDPPDNHWNALCRLDPDPEVRSNWVGDLRPSMDSSVLIPAGAGTTRLQDGFSSLGGQLGGAVVGSVDSLGAGLLVDVALGGLSLTSPTTTSTIHNLTFLSGTINVASELVLTGDATLQKGGIVRDLSTPVATTRLVNHTDAGFSISVDEYGPGAFSHEIVVLGDGSQALRVVSLIPEPATGTLLALGLLALSRLGACRAGDPTGRRGA